MICLIQNMITSVVDKENGKCWTCTKVSHICSETCFCDKLIFRAFLNQLHSSVYYRYFVFKNMSKLLEMKNKKYIV